MSHFASDTSQTTASNLLAEVFDRVCSSPGMAFLIDGGTGEELFTRIPDDRKLWAATGVAYKKNHAVVKDVHRSFVMAGAQAITTVYGITPAVGFSDDEIEKYTEIAGQLAREVVSEEEILNQVFVFESLCPLGESYRADLILEHKRGVSLYQKIAEALEKYVDAFLAETLASVEEGFQVIQGICHIQKPLLMSFTVNSAGNLRSRKDIITSIHRILKQCKHQKVKLLAILCNCSEPESILRSLTTIRDDKSLCVELESQHVLLGAYANRLTPVDPNWTMAESEEPQPLRLDLSPSEYYRKFVGKCIDLDVKIVGGCCGISPAHIAFLKQHINCKSEQGCIRRIADD